MKESNDTGRKTPTPTPAMKRLIEQNESELSLAHGNLLSATEGRNIKSLFITSCHPREGKTLSAVSLAYSIAKYARMHVLLVDGNLVQPDLHRVFGTTAGPGLTNVIYDGVDLADCIQATGLENVSLLTCGDSEKKSGGISPEPYEGQHQSGKGEDSGNTPTTEYRSREFDTTMKRLCSEYDLVIFDGPALLTSSDAFWACPQFDGALLVIAAEDTKWEIAQHVREKLESVGGTLLGAVLNRRKYYVPSSLYRKY